MASAPEQGGGSIPPEAPDRPRDRRDVLVGYGVSLAVHLVLFALLFHVTWMAAGGGIGAGEREVGIAAEEKGPAIESGDEGLLAPEVEAAPVGAIALAEEAALEPIEAVGGPGGGPVSDGLVLGPGPGEGSLSAMEAVIASRLGGGAGMKGDWSGFSVSGGGGGGDGTGSWDGLIRTLRRNGFDIVLTFDSTGSMANEIQEVKTRIAALGKALLTLVPKARIGICTYRDERDEYVVKGLPLTTDVQALEQYLAGITAQAGGDRPEAVHKALDWAVRQNAFRPRARKVILLFGDAPPHPQNLAACLATARNFHGQSGGIISTVTCGRGEAAVDEDGPARPRGPDQRLPEFVRIAEAGGGEAFLITDHTKIVTQLMVLAFGSRHRDKVIEALRLTGD